MSNKLREVFTTKEIPEPSITFRFDQINPEFIKFVERIIEKDRKRQEERDE